VEQTIVELKAEGRAADGKRWWLRTVLLDQRNEENPLLLAEADGEAGRWQHQGSEAD